MYSGILNSDDFQQPQIQRGIRSSTISGRVQARYLSVVILFYIKIQTQIWSSSRMSIQNYFNRKKEKFTSFFVDLIQTIEKVSQATQLQIDQEYDLACKVLKKLDSNAIERSCLKMEAAQKTVLFNIIDEMTKSAKSSIERISKSDNYKAIIPVSQKTPEKKEIIHQTFQEPIEVKKKTNNFYSAPKSSLYHSNSLALLQNSNEHKGGSYSGVQSRKVVDLHEIWDKKIQSQAMNYLAKTESKKKQKKREKNHLKKIFSHIDESSFGYNTKLSQIIAI